MLILLPLLLTLATPGENLLANPGFEAGAEGWSLPANYAVDTAVAHTGGASLRVDNADPAVYQLAGQPLPVEPGLQYVFSVWVRTEGVEGDDSGATVCVEWSGPDGYLGGSYPSGTKGTQDWTQISGVSAPLPDAATSVRFTLYLRKGMTGRAWFDDAHLEVAYPPPLAVNLLEPGYRARFRVNNPAARAAVRVRLAEVLPDRRPLDDVRLAVSVEPGDPPAAPPTGREATPLHRMLTPMSREVTVYRPLRGLAPGEHHVRVALVDAESLAVLAEQHLPLTALPADAEPPAVVIDEHGRTLVGGRPFLPLGLYDGSSAPEDLARMAAAGFNCVMPYGINGADLAKPRGYLDAAQAAGLHVIYSVKDFYDGTRWRPKQAGPWTEVEAMTRGVVETFRDHPALLAWYLNDELPPSYHAELKARYRTVRELDPEHPCWIVLYQVDQLGQYLDTTDVLGTDPYPVPMRPLALAGQWTRRTVDARGPGGGVWQVPQAHDWSNYGRENGRAPTLGELRSMTFQCLAEGARGLIYYSYMDLKRDPLSFETRWADMTALAGEVNQLAPYVLSVEPAPDLALAPDDPDEVFAHVWRLGDELLVLAANGRYDAPATVTWRLPAGCGQAKVWLGEAASVDAEAIRLGPAQAAAVRVALP